MEKVLGKIKSIKMGYGGYQNVQFGVSIVLEGDGCGCGDFKGTWSLDIKRSKDTQWTEADRDKTFAETMRWLNDIMKQAKVKSLIELKNIPVEIIFVNNQLKEWRILSEVL